MKKFLKYLLAIVGVVALLLVVAAFVLPMIVDPNNYKEEISAAVSKKTGRDLNIGGDIKWSVFPSIGLELSDVTLANQSGFGDQPMLDIGEAGISVKFLPLLKRKVEVGEVSMNDVSIHLSRKADGKNNWDDLGGAKPADNSASSSSGRGFDSLTISGIEISNAKVTFNDVDQTTELKSFDLKASNIELGRPFNLQGSFSMNLPTSQLAGDVKFGGLVQTEASGKRFGINGLELAFKGKQGAAGDTVSLDVNVSANADIDLSKDQAILSGFALRLYDLSVTGDLKVSSLTATPKFTGELKVAEFSPKSLMKSMGMEVPVTADDKALTRLRADMKFTGSTTSADMQNLSMVFDQSTFKGNLNVVNFDSPKLAFDFQVDQLNLDDYLPPDDGTASGSASGSGGSDLSVEVFRGFTGGGNFKISRLVVAGLTATDVNMKMNSNGNMVQFAPINANFYGGKHEGDITIDASGSRPILKANHGLTGVQAEGLLTDLTGSARLRGTGDFFLQIKTDLSNPQTVMQDLSGDIGMNIVDGEIIGIDIADTLAAVKSALGKQSELVSEASAEQTTEFAELTMSGVIDHGVLNSDDLIMQSPLIRATGKGEFNLAAETIDYTLKPVLLGKQAGQDLGKLEGVAIPVKLTGNLYEPDIRVDIVAALAESQKEKINQKKDELIDKLLGGEEDGSAEKEDPAKTLLKGLLGGKKDSGKKKDDDGGVD
ncbi:MAG: AsmA family protein [Lysobacterales bacterium]